MQSFTPLEYLKIDIASNFGLGKEDWTKRITWFDDNEPHIAALAALNAKQLKDHLLMKLAEEPALFYAGALAYSKTKAGLPTGYPISLDATASGAQILSVLIGCEKSARLCNVVSTGHREDLYKNIYQSMRSRLTQDAGTIDKIAVKKTVMTSLYGSEKMPKTIFGEGEQLACFYETMETDVPGIWELNTALLQLWQKDALSHDWVLPDNFHSKNKVMGKRTEYAQFFNSPVEVVTTVNAPQEKGRSMGANITHSIDGMIVREMGRRCTYDSQKVKDLLFLMSAGSQVKPSRMRPQDELLDTLIDHYLRTGFLSARVIDCLDAQNIGMAPPAALFSLLNSLPMKPFQVMTVHDCFRVHPNYGNDLRQQYAHILGDICDSTILDDIASQILQTEIVVEKRGLKSSDVRVADYQLS